MPDQRRSPAGVDGDAAANAGMLALRILGWLFTVAALPFLLAALAPAAVNHWWLVRMLTDPDQARQRCFIAGLLTLQVGVIHYLAARVIPRLRH